MVRTNMKITGQLTEDYLLCRDDLYWYYSEFFFHPFNFIKTNKYIKDISYNKKLQAILSKRIEGEADQLTVLPADKICLIRKVEVCYGIVGITFLSTSISPSTNHGSNDCKELAWACMVFKNRPPAQHPCTKVVSRSSIISKLIIFLLLLPLPQYSSIHHSDSWTLAAAKTWGGLSSDHNFSESITKIVGIRPAARSRPLRSSLEQFRRCSTGSISDIAIILANLTTKRNRIRRNFW